MSPQDVQLLERWCHGRDAEAFQEIVNRYAALVYGASIRILRNDSDAQDVAQDCFLHMTEALTDVRTSLSGWLHAMATRRALNRLKQDRQRIKREQTYFEALDGQREIRWDDIQEHIDATIADLREDLRYPVIQHYLLGRTYESIGEELGVTRQAVGHRVQKAIEIVRRGLRRKGIPVGAGALGTLLGQVTIEAAPALLLRRLGNAAVAGVDATALPATTAAAVHKGGTSLMLKVLAASGIAAVVAVVVALVPSDGSKANRQSGRSTFSDEAGAIAPLSPEQEQSTVLVPEQNGTPSQAIAPIVLAQAQASESERPDWYEPDFFQFSLDRPTPKSGPGAIYFYVRGEEAVGAEAAVAHINWRPWEVAPEDPPMYKTTVPEDKIVYFRNLPLGDYHIVIHGKTTTYYWYCTLSESFPLFKADAPLYPSRETTYRFLDEDGGPVPNVTVYFYSGEHLGAPPHPFNLAPVSVGTAFDDGRVVYPRVLLQFGCRLYAKAPGFAPVVSQWILPGVDDTEIVMTRGGTVQCRVVEGDSDDPVEGAIVALHGPYYRDLYRSWSDEDGWVQIPNVRAGDYDVRLYGDDLVLANPGLRVHVSDGDVTEVGDVEAAAGATLRGRVFDGKTTEGVPGVELDVQVVNGLPVDGVVTDSEGYYEIQNAAFAQYTITRKPTKMYGHASGPIRLELSVDPGGVRGDPNFELFTGIPVTGRITDKQGRSIHGAIVWAGYSPFNRPLECLSDRDGTFHLSGLSRPGQVYIEVRGAAYGRTAYGPFDLTEEGIQDLTLRVPVMAAIAGRVTGDHGSLPASTFITATRRLDHPNDMAVSPSMTYTGTPAGTFFLTPLAAGTFDFTVRPPGQPESPILTTLTVEEGERVTDLVLVYRSTGLSLAGRITNARGEAVAMARIFLTNVEGSTSYLSMNTTSNADGAFTMAGLGEGPFNLTVLHDDYTTATQGPVSVGDQDLHVVMQDKGSVSGRMRKALDGTPVERFQIRSIPEETGVYFGPQLNFVSFFNENGEYTLEKMDAGPNTLFVRAKGYATQAVFVPDVRPGQTTRNIMIDLEPAPTLAGTVFNEDGEPVKGAVVTSAGAVTLSNLDNSGIARTDAEGRFETDELPIGTLSVSVVHPDYAPETFPVTLNPGERLELDITLMQGGTIQGTVFGEDGVLPNIQVFIQRLSAPSFMRDTITDSNGQYTLTGMAPGDYAVIAFACHTADCEPPNARITFEGDEELVVDLVAETATP